MFSGNPYTFHRKENLFIISLEYKVPIEEIEKHLEGHRKFLDLGYENKYFIASGPKDPRTSGIILARAFTQEDLAGFLSADPFCIHNLAEYSITLFNPTKVSDEFRPVLDVSAQAMYKQAM